MARFGCFGLFYVQNDSKKGGWGVSFTIVLDIAESRDSAVLSKIWSFSMSGFVFLVPQRFPYSPSCSTNCLEIQELLCGTRKTC